MIRASTPKIATSAETLAILPPLAFDELVRDVIILFSPFRRALRLRRMGPDYGDRFAARIGAFPYGTVRPLLLNEGGNWRVLPVKRIHSYAIAAALVFAGITKMVLQASAQSTLILPTCLGKSVTISIESAGAQLTHCWGRYVLLLGLLAFGALLLNDLRHSRLRTRSVLS